MAEVKAPLHISSRLMAALKINGAGTLHLHADHRDSEGRVGYTWVIEDATKTELATGDDISSGVGAEVNYTDTMDCLLSFLQADADIYRRVMSADADEEWHFSGKVAEWAYMNDDELSMARCELGDPEDI